MTQAAAPSSKSLIPISQPSQARPVLSFIPTSGESVRRLNVPSNMSAHHPNAEAFKIGYDGRLWALLRLQLLNALLLLPSIGVYRFWAITRIRRYLWESISINGARLEYSGTGWQLFMGLLVVMLVFIPVSLLTYGGLFYLAQFSTSFLNFANLAFLLLLLYLNYVGAYLRRRYILTHTHWRAIRGGVDGSAWRFGFYGLRQSLWVWLSFGLYKPWATMKLHERFFQNVRLGNQTLVFKRLMKGLFWRWLLKGLALGVAFICVGIMISAEVAQAELPIILDFNDRIILWSIAGGAGLIWAYMSAMYQATLYRNIIHGFEIQGLQAHSRLSGWHLFRINLVMLLIIGAVIVGVGSVIGGVFYTEIDTYITMLSENTLPTQQQSIQMLGIALAWIIPSQFMISFFSPIFYSHRLIWRIVTTTSVAGHWRPDQVGPSPYAQEERGEGLARAVDMGGF